MPFRWTRHRKRAREQPILQARPLRLPLILRKVGIGYQLRFVERRVDAAWNRYRTRNGRLVRLREHPRASKVDLGRKRRKRNQRQSHKHCAALRDCKKVSAPHPLHTALSLTVKPVHGDGTRRGGRVRKRPFSPARAAPCDGLHAPPPPSPASAVPGKDFHMRRSQYMLPHPPPAHPLRAQSPSQGNAVRTPYR